jgi:hypothetical protein
VHAYKQRTVGPELEDGKPYICTSYAPLDLRFHPVDSGQPGSIKVVPLRGKPSVMEGIDFDRIPLRCIKTLRN